MNMDAELETWREQWQEEAAPPADLRKRVERQSRWMRIMRVNEILITIVFGGGTVAWAIESGRGDVTVLAALTWLSIAMAWWISIANTRGLWSAGETHADFLDISIHRCRAQIKATLFASLLYFFNLTFTLSWVYQAQPIRPVSAFLLSWKTGIVWFVTLLFFVWLLLHRRRKQAELARLLAMQEELELSMLH